MSTVELQLAIDWLKTALIHELNGDSESEIDRAIDLSAYFADKSTELPIYSFSKANNQPSPQNKGYFVTCTKRDMQPYRCNSILADDLADAYYLAICDAEKYGESFAIINTESFEF